MAIRIAMFSWESLHSIAVGGVAAHVTELAAALRHKGHEVHVFSGRCCTQKGPDHLVEAIPHVLRYYPRAKFVFAGDGHLRHGLENRTRQLGVTHAARFLGHRNGQELVDIYKACDVVCVPSRNEPFGITVLEAWAAGKPVVASQNGGPREYVWHNVNGLQIYPRVDSVAWGLGTILKDLEWARWMGANGRIAVETAFTWDKIADITLQCYQS